MKSCLRFCLPVVLAGCGSLDRAPLQDEALGERTSALVTLDTKLVDELTGDGTASDIAGDSVGVDGEWAVVGAPNHRDGTGPHTGAAYVFHFQDGKWRLQTHLAPSAGAEGDGFGLRAVLNGDTLAVAATKASGGAGKVSVYLRKGTDWVLQADLVPTGADRDFGISLALASDLLVIGADGQVAAPGAAYVFQRAGTTWTKVARLEPAGNLKEWQFGWSVALCGDTIAVGAPQGPSSTGEGSGAVHLFEGGGATWTATTIFSVADGEVTNGYGGFGFAVTCAEDTLLVGSPLANSGNGVAHLAQRSKDWLSATTQVLSPPAETGGQFGFSVAVKGARALVAEPGSKTTRGNIYAFDRGPTTWDATAKLIGTAANIGDQLGFSLAWDGATVLAGSNQEPVGLYQAQGAAHAFTNSSGSTWTEQPLRTGDGADSDKFGSSVAAFEDRVLVGAEAKAQLVPGVSRFVFRPGEARVYHHAASGWAQEALLGYPLDVDHAGFGHAVALSSSDAVIGAPEETSGGFSSRGGAYAFTRTGSSWSTGVTLSFPGAVANQHIGAAVALSAQSLIVGATGVDPSGGVFLFERTGATWGAGVSVPLTGGSGVEKAGFSVAIDGDLAVAGAPLALTGGHGAAYVLRRTNAQWALAKRLNGPSVGIQTLAFGSAVAVRGSRIYVAGPTAVEQTRGAVLVYDANADFALVASLQGNPGDHLGYSLAVESDRLAVGTYDTVKGGGVQLFASSGTTFARANFLRPTETLLVDGFATSSIGLASPFMIAGAPGNARGNMGLPGEGAAYIYKIDSLDLEATGGTSGGGTGGVGGTAGVPCTSGVDCVGGIITGGSGGAVGAGGVAGTGGVAGAVGDGGRGGVAGTGGVVGMGGTGAGEMAGGAATGTPGASGGGSIDEPASGGATDQEPATPIAGAADSSSNGGKPDASHETDGGYTLTDKQAEKPANGCGCQLAAESDNDPNLALGLLLVGGALARRRRHCTSRVTSTNCVGSTNSEVT